MQEVQLTKGAYGHMLNSLQVFSPDDQWIVYDTRNDQTHISRTCCIEKVHVSTGEIVRLYSAPNQTDYGPGVGAAAWHPFENKAIFIHGLMNCDESRPYGFTRRFGAIWDDSNPARVMAADARAVDEPLIPGALRGGTHAHSWSGDGEWISFTYNDFIMENRERESAGRIKDIRTIGVMSDAKGVVVPSESAENFSGGFYSVVAATVTQDPQPGSDEVAKAFDECWVGDNGYIRKDGSRQKRAIAFQGHVATTDSALITEIFVSDIPDDITRGANDEPVEGTISSRPAVPDGITQRRITFTQDRRYPGVQGPRAWLRSSPDGSMIYFLMKDDEGIVQVYSTSVNGGEIHQESTLPYSVQSQFNVSPDGKSLAIIADNSIWLCDITDGRTERLTARSEDENAPLSAVVWNKPGTALVYNRYVRDGDELWLQIFKVNTSTVHGP